MEIKKVQNVNDKKEITNLILRNLPNWFGIEEGIVEYVEESKNTDFYVAYDVNKPLGFISIRSNNRYTSEVYIIGVIEEYHNKGIGRKLLKVAEEELKKNNVKFLMVKTLGEAHPDKYYKLTREFYNRCGFYPLEEIKEIWGEENPCLIMVKALVE